jgi:SAM-dependent methyltransferase
MSKSTSRLKGEAENHQKDLWESNRHLDYHLRQFENPYRSTVHLGEFVRNILGNSERSYRAIDVGCGAGANIYYLSKILTRTHWVGVDISERLLEVGRSLMTKKENGTAVDFECCDFYELDERFPAGSFDIVLSIQTLSWLDGYERLLPQLLRLVGCGTVFISSLFTDCLVDAHIEVNQYDSATNWNPEGPYFYNVYCLDKFRDFCEDLGAKRVTALDFQIDVDLAPPSHRHMSTYTRKLSDGTRLQCSGPLWLPWKFVAIQMEEK